MTKVTIEVVVCRNPEHQTTGRNRRRTDTFVIHANFY